MDTKKLRQKILDLAIRGKLTPQDPNDEPASVLLERIRAEKERLVKEGKIKRSKKSTTDEEIEAPFEIPESWEWCIVDDFSYVAAGSTPSKDAFVENGIPYIKMYNLRNQKIDFYFHPQYIKPEVHNGKLQRSRTEVGDLIMNIVGPPLGKMAIIPQSLSESNFNQAAVLIRPYLHKEILVKYLFYYLSQMSEINSISTKGSAGQVNISLTQSQNMRVAMPPLSEQKRIINEIERWFAVIDELESNEGDLLKTIDKAKSKILDLAIHGKLVPQDPNDEPAIELLKRINPKFEACVNVDNIPDSWINCRIQDVFKIAMGSSPVGESLNRNGDGIEFHQGKLNFTELYLGLSDIYTTQSVKLASPNSILLCVRAPVGVVNITKREVCIGRGLCSLAPMNVINLMYGLYALQTCKIDFEQKATGSTFKAIGGDVVKNQIIPLPPYNEQLRIVVKIEELFAVLDSIKLYLS